MHTSCELNGAERVGAFVFPSGITKLELCNVHEANLPEGKWAKRVLNWSLQRRALVLVSGQPQALLARKVGGEDVGTAYVPSATTKCECSNTMDRRGSRKAASSIVFHVAP